MTQIHSNLLKKNNFFLILCVSLVFTQFYYFNWGSRALISNNYLFLNSLTLFIFSFFSFFLIFKIFYNFKKSISKKKTHFLAVVLLTFIYFKIIQIPFFFANSIHLKSIISLGLKKLLSTQLYPLIPFLKILIPFFVLFIFIFYFYEKYNRILVNFIISFSLIFLIFIFNDVNKRKNHLDTISLKKNLSLNKRQVVWFILDEYDPEYINYEKYGLKLNHIKDLMNKSFTHKNSFSPSNSTLHSVPSILMKTYTKGSKIVDYELNIIDTDNNNIKFEYKNTLFSKIYNNDFNFKIISEVLPYCSMLRLSSNCNEFTNRNNYFLDGIKKTFLPEGYIYKISKLFSRKEKFDLNKINKINEFDNKKILLSNKLNINFYDLEKLLNENINLIFFHLFIPHTKTITSDYIKKNFNNTFTKNDDEEYFLNLKFTDIIIDNIFSKIEKNKKKDILLILSSDHWRRGRSPDKAQPALLLMKIKSDNSRVEILNQNSNIYIYDVIEKYLSKKVNFHNDIKLIFENSKSFNPEKTYLWKK